MYLSYGCELLGALSDRGLESTRGVKLLEVWLACLEEDVAPDAASRLALEAKALTFAGLAPALVQCPVCGQPLVDDVRFDMDAGGGVHAWCGSGESVLASSLEVLERLRRTPLRETPGIDVPDTVRWLLGRFIEYQVRAGLRSRGLVETMEVT
jgi:recombinational DNA repair protein (RecF pathway)